MEADGDVFFEVLTAKLQSHEPAFVLTCLLAECGPDIRAGLSAGMANLTDPATAEP